MSRMSRGAEEWAQVRDDEQGDRTSEVFAEALRAPGRPEELAGLEPALAAFRSAQSDPAQRPNARGERGPSTSAHRRRPPSWRKPVLAAAVSAFLFFLGATTVAETGALPGPVQQMAHTVLGGIGVPRHGQRHRADSSTATATGLGGSAGAAGRPSGASPTGWPPDPSPSQGPTSTPTSTPMSDADLCKAILVDQKGLHSKTIDPAARNRLTAAAGGEDRIIAYCESLLTAAGVSYPPPSAASEHHPSPAPPRDRTSSR